MSRKARIARCYTEQSLEANQTVELDKRSSHHLSTVLRTKDGTSVYLFNGDGNSYSGEVIETGKKTKVQLSTVSASHLESPLTLTLVQAIARGDKMDGIVQKATELGVSAIQPVYTQHSIAKLDEKREKRKCEHWQAIVIAACEQSGRCTLPVVHMPIPLTSYLQNLPPIDPAEQRWVLSPIAQASNTKQKPLSSATVLVGPESGFDEEELKVSESAHFSQMQLGPRVLRTETAGPAVLAVLQASFGDLN